MKRLMMLLSGVLIVSGLSTQHVSAKLDKPKAKTTKKVTSRRSSKATTDKTKKKLKVEAEQRKAKKTDKKRVASKKAERKSDECRYDCNSHAKGEIWFKCISGKENFIKCARKSLDKAEKCNRACHR